jgi:hypothetical protein
LYLALANKEELVAEDSLVIDIRVDEPPPPDKLRSVMGESTWRNLDAEKQVLWQD